MIKLEKIEEPQVLRDNYAVWTERLQERQAAGETASNTELSRYSHPEIKAALIKETAGKCAYCESKILHISYGDVEHIVPKSSDLNLRFSWHNLTIACDICNTKKGVKSDLVDPYQDDPADYFAYFGDLIFAYDDDGKGFKTFVVLDLNRSQLRERRANRIAYIESLISVYRRVSDAETREALRENFAMVELADSSEYAASVRKFVEIRAPDLLV